MRNIKRDTTMNKSMCLTIDYMVLELSMRISKLCKIYVNHVTQMTCILQSESCQIYILYKGSVLFCRDSLQKEHCTGSLLSVEIVLLIAIQMKRNHLDNQSSILICHSHQPSQISPTCIRIMFFSCSCVTSL